MKHIKTFENTETWAKYNNIKVNDYVKYLLGPEYGENIYHVTMINIYEKTPSYRLVNVFKMANNDDSDNYWSQLSDNYKKLTPKQIKQIEQQLINQKYNL